MDHGDNINLIGLYSVDNSIWFFNQFPDVFGVILGDLPAGQSMFGDLLGSAGNLVDHPPGIGWRIERYVFIDIGEMRCSMAFSVQ